MNFGSMIDGAVVFLQYHHFVSIALIVALVVFLLWKPKVFFKLVFFLAIFAGIFYGVFYFGSYFSGGMKVKKEAVQKTERQLEADRLAVPPRE